MNRIDVFVRRQRIHNLEKWTIRAILAEAFFLPIFPSVAETAVVLGVICWFLRLQIDTKFKMRSLPFDIPVSIFIMLGAVSVFASPVRSFGLIYDYCAVVGLYGLTYLLVGQNIRTVEQLKDLAKALGAAAVIVALVGYFQYIFGIDIAEMKWADGELHPELRRHIFSTLANPNVLAGYLDVIICLVLGFLAKFGARREKLFLTGAIIFLAACLAMTYSHGAFLALAVVFLIYGFLQDWRILTVLALVVGVAIYNDANFFEKFWAIFSAPNDFSGVPRAGIWVSTISMIADHPFAGIGWGAYEKLYPQYNYYLAATPVTQAHNLYLQTAAEVGIAGALSYFWYFFGTMFTALALHSNSRYSKLKSATEEIVESKLQKMFNEQLIKTFSTSKFLQVLAQSKSMLMLRMADLSNKILDKVSPQAESKKPEKKSAPELVHHEEMKWHDKKSKDDKKSDDDKFDVQKFAAEELFETEKPNSDAKFAAGFKFGIGLAFVSMALNGMTDDLLFDAASSMLMWMLGALVAAVNLLDDED